MKNFTAILLFVLTTTNLFAQLSTNKENNRLLYKRKPVDHRIYSSISINKERKYATVGFDTLGKTLYGCYDKNGQNIVPIQYAEVYSERVNKSIYFHVSKEVTPEKFSNGMYNSSGKQIVPDTFGGIEILWHENNLIFLHAFDFDNSGKNIQGVYSLDGNLLLPPIYNSVNVIYDESSKTSYFQLTKDSFYGMANIQGQIIIPPIYENIDNLSIENVSDESYFRAKKGDLYYLYNGKGLLLTGSGHHEISIGFCGGHRLFTTTKVLPDGKQRYGFADRITGKQITPSIYNEYALISRDLFRVQSDSGWGLVDLNGENLKPLYPELVSYGDSGTCGIEFNHNHKYRIYLPREKQFLNGDYETYEEQWPYLMLEIPINDSTFGFKLYNIEQSKMFEDTFSNYNVFDFFQTGKQLNSKRKSQREFSRIISISKGNQWFIIDGLSKMGIPGNWIKCKALNNQLFAVQNSGKMGIINIHNKVILPFDYDDIIYSKENEFLLKKDQLFGMCDQKGNIFIPIEYSEPFGFYDEKAYVKKGTESFYISKNNKRIKDK